MYTKTIYTPEDVAEAFQKDGIPAEVNGELCEYVDGEVTINDNIYVQVGEGYLILCRQEPEEPGPVFRQIVERTHPHEVIPHIQNLLDQEKKNVNSKD